MPKIDKKQLTQLSRLSLDTLHRARLTLLRMARYSPVTRLSHRGIFKNFSFIFQIKRARQKSRLQKVDFHRSHRRRNVIHSFIDEQILQEKKKEKKERKGAFIFLFFCRFLNHAHTGAKKKKLKGNKKHLKGNKKKGKRKFAMRSRKGK